MGAENHSGVVLYQILDRGHGTDDPLVTGDDPVLHGNIEITAHQAFFAVYINVLNAFLIVHRHLHAPRNSEIFLRISSVPGVSYHIFLCFTTAFCEFSG